MTGETKRSHGRNHNHRRRKRQRRQRRRFFLAFLIFGMAYIVINTTLHHSVLIYNDDDGSLISSSSSSSPFFWSVGRRRSSDILPKKLITVIGKESSGTTFVTETLATALNLDGNGNGNGGTSSMFRNKKNNKKKTTPEKEPFSFSKYRDGFDRHEKLRYDDNPIQVQHISLPHGESCFRTRYHHIVNVIVPPHCIRNGRRRKTLPSFIQAQCEQFLKGTTTTTTTTNSTSRQQQPQQSLLLFEGNAEVPPPWFQPSLWKPNSIFAPYRYPGFVIPQGSSSNNSGNTITTTTTALSWNQSQEQLEQQQERLVIKRVPKRRAAAAAAGFFQRHSPKENLVEEWLYNIQDVTLDELKQQQLIHYPVRFLLNITAQKLWYEQQKVEHVIVIVVRDKRISLKSRLKRHCRILSLAMEEEQIANAILNTAIRTFLLTNEDNDNHNNTTSSSSSFMEEDLLWDPTRIIENNNSRTTDPNLLGGILYASMIPHKNNVILVSYEALLQYQGDYVQELYKILGIDSTFIPQFKDGNAKYTTSNNNKTKN